MHCNDFDAMLVVFLSVRGHFQTRIIPFTSSTFVKPSLLWKFDMGPPQLLSGLMH